MKKLLLYTFSIIVLVACSTRKDRFVNKNYHALVTKFNVKYNGEEAFKKGVQLVYQDYQDDFYQTLPIEPFSVYTNDLTNESKEVIGKTEFDLAEEKAVKAIQKHSMLIGGEEKNSQIDETYLLLGKSRYFTGRFAPALESFQYITKNYPTASLIFETVVWRAKTNIRLGNTAFAKKALKRMLHVTTISEAVRQDAEVALVMAYQITPDSMEVAIPHLEEIVKHDADKNKTARALFILGQLYRDKGDLTLSNKYFTQLLEKKSALYKYRFQASLELVHNNTKDGDVLANIEQLEKFEKLHRNKPYWNTLYFEKGEVYKANDSIDKAVLNYNKSLRATKRNTYHKGLTYERLANIYFDKANYSYAKSYYDSVVKVTPNKKTERIREIKKRSYGLKKVVSLEGEAKKMDSLLYIASLSDADLEAYFTKHIENLKAIEKEKEEQAQLQKLEREKRQAALAEQANKGKWYFYNTGVLQFGKEEFFKTWGKRPFNNNWFLKSKKAKIATKDAEQAKTQDKKGAEQLDKNGEKIDPRYNLNTYLNKVPKDQKIIDSLKLIRNLDYYELGNIYHKKFKEYTLATDKVQQLLSFEPQERLKIGAYYRLYKIYEDLEVTDRQTSYRNLLETQYPNAAFTRLLNQSDEDLQSVQNSNDIISAEDCYKIIYELYETKAYEAAFEEIEQAIQLYEGLDITPKLYLLKAYISAKHIGKDAYKENLKYVRQNFPKTIESKKAQEILRKI